MKLTDWLIARLSEDSTWKGIILVLTGFGVKVAPDMAQSIIALGLAAVGIIQIARKQAASKDCVFATVTAAIKANNAVNVNPLDPEPPKAVFIEAAPQP